MIFGKIFSPQPNSHNKKSLYIFLFFSLIFISTSGAHPDAYDGIVSFMMAENFLHSGLLSITEDSEIAKSINFDVKDRVITTKARIQADHKYKTEDTNLSRSEYIKAYLHEVDYSNFNPPGYLLLPIIIAPLYYISNLANIASLNFVSLLVNFLIISSMTLFVYLISWSLYKSEKIGFIQALSFGLSTFIWPYINSLVSRPLSMLFLLFGIWLLLSYRKKCNSYFPILLGITFGLSILSHNIILLLFPIFLFIGIYEFKNNKKHVAFFIITLFLFLLIQGIFNEYRFGDFLDFGFGTQQQGSDLLKNIEGLYAYLISPGRSIFVYFPLFFLFPISWILFFKKDKLLALTFIGIIIVTYFYIGTSNIWDSAGGMWGPHRYLLPIIPLVIITLGTLFEKFQSTRFKIIFILLATVGFVVNLLGKLVWYRFLWSFIWHQENITKTNVDTTWNLFDSVVFQAFRVIQTSYVENLTGQAHFLKIGLTGCAYDLFFYCSDKLFFLLLLSVTIVFGLYVVYLIFFKKYQNSIDLNNSKS